MRISGAALWRPMSLCHCGNLCPYVTMATYVTARDSLCPYVTAATYVLMSFLRPMSLIHRGDPCPYVTVATHVLTSLW